MTSTSEIDRDRTPTHWVQIGFYTTSIVFNLCLIAQLLTVGVAYFNDPSWWNIHVWLVRGYGGLSFILWGWSSIAPWSIALQLRTIADRDVMTVSFVL